MIDHGGTTMKLLGAISTVIFSLTLGATALAYPQQGQRDRQDEKKAQPEELAKQDSPRREENVKPEEEDTRQKDRHTQQGFCNANYPGVNIALSIAL
jgi:hypothetical protein